MKSSMIFVCLIIGILIIGCSSKSIETPMTDCGINTPDLEDCFKDALKNCAKSQGLLDSDGLYFKFEIIGEMKNKCILDMVTNNDDVTGKDDSKRYKVRCEYPANILDEVIVGDDYFSVETEYCFIENG